MYLGDMVVPTHSLVAPPWSNEPSMVISSLLYEHFNVFSLCQFFLRERTRLGKGTFEAWLSSKNI